jgi:hypothetical protein
MPIFSTDHSKHETKDAHKSEDQEYRRPILSIQLLPPSNVETDSPFLSRHVADRTAFDEERIGEARLAKWRKQKKR